MDSDHTCGYYLNILFSFVLAKLFFSVAQIQHLHVSDPDNDEEALRPCDPKAAGYPLLVYRFI